MQPADRRADNWMKIEDEVKIKKFMVVARHGGSAEYTEGRYCLS